MILTKCLNCNTNKSISSIGIDLCDTCSQLMELTYDQQVLLDPAHYYQVNYSINPFTYLNINFESPNLISLSSHNLGTSSIKDRASLLCLYYAKKYGHKSIAVASCGNAGLSTAYWANVLGLSCHVYLSKSVDSYYLDQLIKYQAIIDSSSSDYSKALTKCTDYCKSSGTYCRNTGINSLTRVAKATFWDSFFTRYQFTNTKLQIIIPIGDGNIFSSFIYWWKYLSTKSSRDLINKIIGISPTKDTIFKQMTFNPTINSSSSEVAPLSVASPTDVNYIYNNLKYLPQIVDFYQVSDRYFLNHINSRWHSTNGCFVTNGLLNSIDLIRTSSEQLFVFPVTAMKH